MKKLTILFLALTLLGCSSEKQSTESADPSEKNKAMLVSNLVSEQPDLAKEEAVNSIFVQGMVEVPPNGDVSIQPYFEGYVKEIQVIEGSKVKRGDLLFKLVNPDFIGIQEDYLMDKANVEFFEQELIRTEKLHDQKVSTDRELQEVQMNYSVVKANLEAVKKTLKLMNLDPKNVTPDNLTSSIEVYSPISGNVDNLMVTSGQYVNRGEEVLSVLNTEHLHLELRFFERDLPFLEEGQTIIYRVPEVSQDSYEAKVYLIGKSVDPTTRLVNVHAHIDEEDIELIPGMFVEATVEPTKSKEMNQ